jgi:micrococcal nuclease
MKTKPKQKFNTNKLVLVPAALLISLLSFLGGTKYEQQVKDALEQPNISTTTVQNLPTKETVKRVIDGDTIELQNGQIVRFVGVNAPDSGQPYEEEATEAVIMILQGKTATFEYDTYTSDRFRRVLAYPFIDGKNVVVELAKQGLVKVTIYQDRRKLKYQDDLLKAEAEAKVKKRGMWSGR